MLRPAVETAARAGGAATVDLESAGPGSPRRLGVRPVRDGRGGLAALLLIELSSQSDLAAEREALRAAHEASERKNQFMAMLAHELRNPLGVVVNALQVIRRRAGEDRQVQRAVQLGERQVRHTARLLDDLLDVSRIVLGKIQLHLEPVDVREVVRRVVEASRYALQAQALRLKLDLPPDPLGVRADPTRLEQCVGNLLSNAVKYTPAGGSITVSARRVGTTAVLVVKDSGVGIAPEMLEQMFELFTQADASLARARGGLGIGLTLARRLVELHGGTLTARSEGLGRGSEFEIRLRAEAQTEAPGKAADMVPAGRRRRRVLVVDDNADGREALRTMLEASGHAVAEAADGPAGVRLAVEWAPDVALIDIGLPAMDGYEVARRIQARLGGLVRLVALTGYSDPGARMRAVAAGFEAHLVKPAAPEEIERLLAAG
jgi:signal transduction histidine kinase